MRSKFAIAPPLSLPSTSIPPKSAAPIPHLPPPPTLNFTPQHQTTLPIPRSAGINVQHLPESLRPGSLNLQPQQQPLNVSNDAPSNINALPPSAAAPTPTTNQLPITNITPQNLP